MQEKHEELAAVEEENNALEANGEDRNQQKEFLLTDYVSVYEQAIAGLDAQMVTAKVEFDIISEEKRLREEQAEAEAATKAK